MLTAIYDPCGLTNPSVVVKAVEERENEEARKPATTPPLKK